MNIKKITLLALLAGAVTAPLSLYAEDSSQVKEVVLKESDQPKAQKKSAFSFVKGNTWMFIYVAIFLLVLLGIAFFVSRKRKKN